MNKKTLILCLHRELSTEISHLYKANFSQSAGIKVELI
jgi:hypothetical protein